MQMKCASLLLSVKFKGTSELGISRKERHLEQNEGRREAEWAQKVQGLVTNILVKG